VISLRKPVSYQSIIHLVTDLKCCQKCVVALEAPATLLQQAVLSKGGRSIAIICR